MAICAKMYKELGLLKNNLIISTVMSNFGFFTAMRQLGIQAGVSQVGDRYVLEMMQDKGAILGGEESGHIICLNHHTSGDGIIAALQLLWAMRLYRQPLSKLSQIMTLSPQKIANVIVANKPPLEDIPMLQEAIRTAETELSDKGRVLIRYSGTQSMCRVMVEGPTQEMTDRLTDSLANTVAKCLG
jgi:phosphoglucosamine mutase